MNSQDLPAALPARRILFVHAHPDDETVGTGATMAHYAAQGAYVALVTCTAGEEGEIHVPELAGLAAAEADQLGGYRIGELAAACAALGVSDHRYLGGAGRYRDSGMMGLPTNDHARAFWRADVDEAARQLVEIIRELRPQVLVTYDEIGFYGHPDHIQAHRVAMRAVELAAVEGIAPEKVYWTAVPRSAMEAGFEHFAGSSDNPFGDVEHVDDLPFGTPDDKIAAHRSVRPGRRQAGRRACARDPDPGHLLAVLPRRWVRQGVPGRGALHACGRPEGARLGPA